MITLDSNHPPLGIWFVGLDDTTDFMGCLNPKLTVNGEPSPGHYVFDFRFRYHKDDLVFDSEDEKHWYHVENREPISPDEVIHKIREMVLRIAEMQPRDEATPPEVDELLWRDYNDWDAFIKAFEDKPYAYAKMVSQEEASKYTGAKP
jgi:hypothetical protein